MDQKGPISGTLFEVELCLEFILRSEKRNMADAAEGSKFPCVFTHCRRAGPNLGPRSPLPGFQGALQQKKKKKKERKKERKEERKKEREKMQETDFEHTM